MSTNQPIVLYHHCTACHYFRNIDLTRGFIYTCLILNESAVWCFILFKPQKSTEHAEMLESHFTND